jgi:hypothetical protein
VARELEYLDEALEEVPFSFVYRVEANRIVIVAVAHGRRRPGYWKSRLDQRD